jgi:hypothetical protein
VSALDRLASVTDGAADWRSRFTLRGSAWVVWREHRAWFRFWIACSVMMTGYLVYWHVRYHATFVELTDPAPYASVGFPPDIGLSVAAFLLTIAPAVTGVAFGAPLFEREFTQGTATLVRAQSMSDRAWVRAKLGVPAAILTACVTPCAAAFSWDLQVDFPMRQNWRGIGVFDAIGPAAVAFCLLGLFFGAAAGLTWRLGGPSKVLTMALVLGFEAAVFLALPHAPYSDLQLAQWIVTGICIAICAALGYYCLRLIEHRHA